METAGILDVIMNSMALTFILGLDEMVFHVLTSAPVKHMMSNLAEYPLFNYEELENHPDEVLMGHYEEKELNRNWSKVLLTLCPRRPHNINNAASPYFQVLHNELRRGK